MLWVCYVAGNREKAGTSCIKYKVTNRIEEGTCRDTYIHGYQSSKMVRAYRCIHLMYCAWYVPIVFF